MSSFPLKIMTPDGTAFDGQVQSVSCRTITGQVQLMARHIDYCTALGMGEAYRQCRGTEPSGRLYGRDVEHVWRRMPPVGHHL